MTTQTDPTAAAVGIARETLPILKEAGGRLTPGDLAPLRQRLEAAWPDMDWSESPNNLTEELSFLIEVEDAVLAGENA